MKGLDSFLNESKDSKLDEGKKIKPFKKVKKNDIATDYNGSEYKVKTKGKVKDLMDYDDFGTAAELDPNEDAIVLQDTDSGESAVFSYDPDGAVVYESLNEGKKIKPFKKVKVGDTGTDTTGEEFTVVQTGTAQDLVDSNYDESGMTEEGIKDGYIDPKEDAVAVKMPKKKGFNGTVVWTYDEGGAVVYESLDEGKKWVDVTKRMWDKMNDEEQEDALLSAIKDPDEAEKYIGYKYNDLPSEVTQNMSTFEGESYIKESIAAMREPLNENKINKAVHDELTNYIGSSSPKQYQYDVKEVLKAALIDANFGDIAKKVDALFPRAKDSTKYGKMVTKEKVADLYRNEGEEIAKIAKWDANDILDAVGFHVSMKVGGELGKKISELKV